MLGRRQQAACLVEQIAALPEHGTVVGDGAARQVEVERAPRGHRHLEVIAHAGAEQFAHGADGWHGQVFHLQHAVHPQVAEQKTREVLEALFRIDDAVRATVAAVHVRPGRTGHVGILDPHQAIAQFTRQQARCALRHVVVLAVGPHQAEEARRVELAIERIGRGFLVLDREIVAHAVAIEIVHVPQLEKSRRVEAAHLDAIVRRGVGEHLVHQLARRRAADLVVLQETAAHQPAHGMRDEIHLEVFRLHLAVQAHLVAYPQDEVGQAPRGFFHGGNPASTKIGIGHIVIAVDDDALGRNPGMLALQAVLVDIGVAQLHQAHDGRLEEHLAHRPVPGLT